jgi:hypothetical protein
MEADGHRNPFYESMREVAPGDHVFSFGRQRNRRLRRGDG